MEDYYYKKLQKLIDKAREEDPTIKKIIDTKPFNVDKFWKALSDFADKEIKERDKKIEELSENLYEKRVKNFDVLYKLIIIKLQKQQSMISIAMVFFTSILGLSILTELYLEYGSMAPVYVLIGLVIIMTVFVVSFKLNESSSKDIIRRKQY